MKVLIKGVVLVGFALIAFFVVNRVFEYNTTDDASLSEKELAEIADTKYYKKKGEVFYVDSIQLTISRYAITKKSDSVFIEVGLMIKNMQPGKSTLENSFFKLKNSADEVFYPTTNNVEISDVVRIVDLKFIVPATDNNYVAYWLHLNSKSNADQKAIMPIYKSYRSEG